jgi:hypothetical protein
MVSLGWRCSPLLIVSLLILAVIAVPAVAIGSLWWSAGQRLEAVEREIESEKAKEGLALRLVPLFPEPLSDDAEVHMQTAADAFKPAGDLGALMGDVGFRPPPFDFPPSKVLSEIWIKYQSAFEEVVKALRCPQRHPHAGAWPVSTSRGAACFLFGAELARQEGRDVESLTRLVTLLGMIQTWPPSDGGGSPSYFETHAVALWNSVLSHHALSAHDAQLFCGLLDRLGSTRPGLLERVRRQCFLRRVDAAEYARVGSENYPGASTEPGWRQLWCHRLLAVEALKATEYDLRELTRICGLPAYEQYAAAQALVDSIPDGRVRIQRRSKSDKLALYPDDFFEEVHIVMHHSMVRIATALAWYEVENGRMPATLDELVPRYLFRIDPNPETGKAVDYKDGILRSPGYWENTEVLWKVRRR